MKARTWRLLRQWDELLDSLIKDTEYLSGGFVDTGSFKEAMAFYMTQSVKMREAFEIVAVSRLADQFDWAVADLIYEMAPDWLTYLPESASGVAGEVQLHILCEAQHAGFYELHGPLSVGDRLIWRPLDSRNRVDCVVAKITPCDGETWVDLETSNGTFPNEEEVVREACVRALPES